MRFVRLYNGFKVVGLEALANVVLQGLSTPKKLGFRVYDKPDCPERPFFLSGITIVITRIRGPVAPLITTHEPPSTACTIKSY